MLPKPYFELMADYNELMNNSIYSAASKLSSIVLAKDQGAFFGSILNTLNHILVADTIWLKRFANHEAQFASLDYVRALPVPESLDEVLFTDLDVLREKREKMDAVLKDFASELTDKETSQPFSYTSTEGLDFRKNFGHILQHFFNHQTHHRGQVSTLLSQEGLDIGVTDLLISIPELE